MNSFSNLGFFYASSLFSVELWCPFECFFTLQGILTLCGSEKILERNGGTGDAMEGKRR